MRRVRCPSWARFYRWTQANRPAVLHERSGFGIHHETVNYSDHAIYSTNCPLCLAYQSSKSGAGFRRVTGSPTQVETR
jgi:hypothetical protein